MIFLDETHDPARTSWVESANGHSEFPIQNLPLGIFTPPGGGAPRMGVAIGDAILDLGPGGRLNELLANPEERRALRARVFALLDSGSSDRPTLHAAVDCVMQLPAEIGDYTDFYAGIHHARNVGVLFRPDDPLLPNYRYVPIGYHGRASSVAVSGAPVRRPNGQTKASDATVPSFGPCRRLDYELEMGVWVGPGNATGEPIPIARAGGHIAGLCLLNDWSARDIQAWEYQPLGPFLAKNFATTVSPWVVTAEALAPFRVAQPPRPEGDPAPLPYLLDAADQASGAFAITLEVLLTTPRMRAEGIAPHRLSKGPMTSLYWTLAQLVAHHSVNGCNLRPGDLLGTGTISGPTPDAFGSLLEISRGGKDAIALPGGETRTFLEDGDEVIFRGHAEAAGRVSIGFGECRGTVVPSVNYVSN